jgi:PAS domain S-box-containing protein
MAREQGQPAQARAWHTEEVARVLLESIPDYGIVMLGPAGLVESWSPGAERLTGWRAEEIVGQHVARFFTADDVAQGRPEAGLRLAAERGRAEDEGWRVRRDGSRYWANVITSAILDSGGRLEGYAHVTRDLSARREAEEARRSGEEQLRMLVDGVKDYAIFSLDPAGLVTSWNAGAERIKGWRADEIIGRHHSIFYAAEDLRAGKPARALEVAATEGRWEDEGWRLRRTGTRFWASVVVTPLRSAGGEMTGFAKVTRDLTERHAAEQDRLGRVRAEEAVRLRDEFLAVVAHELNTPITALHLQVQALQRHLGGREAALVERLGPVGRSSARLVALVSELLNVSRLAEGRLVLHPAPCALEEVVAKQVEALRERAALARCEVRLGIEAGPVVGTWDRLRLEQAVGGLLGNALRYGAGSPIEVRVGLEDDAAVLRVTDHGPGVPEEALTRIFGRFEQAAPTTSFGGLGLGLFMVREIVRRHGGTVEAANAEGGGARFTVRLPLAGPQAASPPNAR